MWRKWGCCSSHQSLIVHWFAQQEDGGLIIGSLCSPGASCLTFLCACPSTGNTGIWACEGSACEDMWSFTLTLFKQRRCFLSSKVVGCEHLQPANTYLVPKHWAKWLHLVGTWTVVMWHGSLLSRLLPIRLAHKDVSCSWFKLKLIIQSRAMMFFFFLEYKIESKLYDIIWNMWCCWKRLKL